jgi:glycosyltransferase involved in cell wall biosynthesis
MKKKKLKILLTSYAPLKESGGAISTYNLSKILRKFGHKVYIASTGQYKDAPTVIIPPYKKKSYLFHIQKNISAKIFEKIIREKKIDIIHSQGWITAPGSVLAAERTGIISIVHFRSYDWLCPNSSLLRKDGTSYNIANFKEIIKNSSLKMVLYNLYKWHTLKSWWSIIKRASGRLAVSRFLQKKMRRIGMDSEVIYSMRELKGNFKKKKKKKKIIVTFISRLDKQKGTELVLKIAPELIKEKNIYFYIAGRGPLQNKIEELSRKHKKIKYLGNIPHKKIGNLYAESDIIVFPVQWEEPVGGMPYECLISGTPLVASKRGGIGEVLVDKKTGYLVPGNDTKKWIEKIVFLAKNPKIRKKMGEYGKKIKNKYSLETLGRQIEKYYYKILNKNSKRFFN